MASLIWSPVNPECDPQIRQAHNTGKDFSPDRPRSVYGVDAGTLDGLRADESLYLVAHGHPYFPYFQIGDNFKFFPFEMAKAISAAGLKLDHRQIVMLVCHGGESIGKKSNMADRWKSREIAMSQLQSKKPRDVTFRNGLLKKIELNKPKEFTSKKQVLPLTCQFIDALKNIGYRSIRVRGYKGTVGSNLLKGIEVKNPLTGKYELATNATTVNWL